MIHTGDCLEVMRTLPEASVDAVVTDPPYGLEFMGKGWDKFGARFRLPSVADGKAYRSGLRLPRGSMPDAYVAGTSYQQWCEAWGREALRVTVPGGYLLAFGGTRTHHRLVCGLEDAGWIIRDELDWIYASGFPKGRANLKPAHEPIVLARKPGPLRMLNIDATRIGSNGGLTRHTASNGEHRDRWEGNTSTGEVTEHGGRWPANVILTDPVFDGGVDGVVGGGTSVGAQEPYDWAKHADDASFAVGRSESVAYGDTGSYSRYFLIPKADRADREPVLRGQLPTVEQPAALRDLGPVEDNPRKPDNGHVSKRENAHPTVKPIELMRHLVRLVTPPGGTVLDPFLGSGTTAIACEMEGFAWIGIEKEAEYVAIAEARLNGVQKGMGLDVPAPTTAWKDYPTAVRYPVKGPSQSSWFTESDREEPA